MPFYDLHCPRCDEEFNIMAKMSDKTNGTIPCPKCGGTGLKTVYNAAPFVLKSSGSGSEPCPNSHICQSGCCHARSS